jgi:hypothetical protein
MSSLSSADLAVIDALVDFARGRGYVLDFSDRTFAAFFSSELGVDIDEPRFADMGGSKASGCAGTCNSRTMLRRRKRSRLYGSIGPRTCRLRV